MDEYIQEVLILNFESHSVSWFQGIYYYFYQILKNKVEDIAVARSKKGLGDGTVGMLSWLGIAAVAG